MVELKPWRSDFRGWALTTAHDYLWQVEATGGRIQSSVHELSPNTSLLHWGECHARTPSCWEQKVQSPLYVAGPFRPGCLLYLVLMWMEAVAAAQTQWTCRPRECLLCSNKTLGSTQQARSCPLNTEQTSVSWVPGTALDSRAVTVEKWNPCPSRAHSLVVMRDMLKNTGRVVWSVLLNTVAK